MLRALGFGAPVAAVAAAVPQFSPSVGKAGAYRAGLVFEADQIVLGRAGIPPFNVASLSAISGNMGQITAGRLIDGDAVWDFGAGTLTIRS
jgi:Iap family predicted aminopeptidase